VIGGQLCIHQFFRQNPGGRSPFSNISLVRACMNQYYISTAERRNGRRLGLGRDAILAWRGLAMIPLEGIAWGIE